MNCLDRFNNRMMLSGNSIRNENIRSTRRLIEEVFADDASLSKGVYIWELGLCDYSYKDPISIRLYKRKFSNANGVTVNFQTPIDTPIIVGDIVYDSKQDEYLICIESFNIDDIHWQGKFNLCNWILKWQDKNGDILEYPCHDINSTQYNSGEQSNLHFTIGSSQHMITLPCDENTVILNTPQRFFLDKNKINPTSFIVTQNDTTSYNYGDKGLVKVTLMECEGGHENDRIDLGICDYFEKDSLKEDNSNDVYISKSVISYKTKTIKSGGDSQIFTAKFFDNNKNEILGIIPKWHIICDFINELEINQFENSIQIGIDNDDYVDEEFKLFLTDQEGNFKSSIIIRIDSLL